MSLRWTRCPQCQVLFETSAAEGVRCAACLATPPPGDPAATAWYVVRNKQRAGPLPWTELRGLASAGLLGADDMVLQEGTRTWVRAGTVVGLLSTVTAPVVFPATVPPPTEGAAAAAPHVPSTVASFPCLPGYEVLAELGRGGMGVVYKARHLVLKRLVALKMILGGGHASPQELSRFKAEAEAVARLKHANVVQIYEVGEYQGLPFFSLEFCDGGTLSARLARTPLPAREAATLTATLALAVEAAHTAGIVHRDLKPANVLLAVSDASQKRLSDGRFCEASLTEYLPKIADFGLAKQLDDDSGQTRTGAIMGTPSYMSPEQASGRTAEVGPAADIYALGAILYECLTGRPPFKAATTLETLEQVRSQEPVSPRSLQPGLPRDLDTICLKCLQKDPAARYPSARALADDLVRFLGNQPILARPAGLVERSVKFVRRNGLLTGSALTIFVALLFTVIVSWIQTAKARAQKALADANAKEAKRKGAEYVFEAGSLAFRKGLHREALKHFEKALEAGYENPRAVRFNMARCYAALSQNDEVRKTLDSMARRGDLGEYEGPALLLRGTLTMGSDVDAGVKLIRRALTKDLKPADEAYARGLLAETSEDAVQLFRQTLVHDPDHHAARTELTTVLFFLGRIAEAREVVLQSEDRYPEDPTFKGLHAMILATEGKLKEARGKIEPMRTQLTARQFRVFRAILSLLDFLRNMENADLDRTHGDLLTLWKDLEKDLDAVWPILPGRSPQAPEEKASRLLAMPPVLTRSLRDVTTAMSALAAHPNDAKTLALMDRALRAHPEGMLYFLFGSMLMAQGRFKEAERELISASRLPSVAGIRRPALVLAVACAAEQGIAGTGDPEALARALAHIDKVLLYGPLRPWEHGLFIKTAVRARAYDLARYLLARWQRQEPGNLAPLRMRLTVEKAAGAPLNVVRAADHLLRRAPKDAEALRERALALKATEQALKKAGNP